LLYERLAISIGQLHSPLPHVHGELIGNVNQLYPLLLAPLFDGSFVPSGLRDGHLLNGFVMSSAAIPAFLLARRVTNGSRLAYVVALLSVCLPWIVLASFLMTEAVAYPAFLWAILALHNTAVSPRARNDALLLVAIGVALLARTPFPRLFRSRAVAAPPRAACAGPSHGRAPAARSRLRRARCRRGDPGRDGEPLTGARNLFGYRRGQCRAERDAAFAARTHRAARAGRGDRAIRARGRMAAVVGRAGAHARETRVRRDRGSGRRRARARGHLVRPPLRR